MIETKPFSGSVWRIVFADHQRFATEPIQSPFGRFHHSKQTALYTSLTEEGATAALRRYVNPNDGERVIVKLDIETDRIFDIRTTDFATQVSIVWQDCVAKGEPAPTWEYSDAARDAGAQGMLYASRSRPDLTHLVLFDVSEKTVLESGVIKPWVPKFK